MGSAGFLYESVKDRLVWANLRKKNWVWLLMRVGEAITLEDDEYNKQRVKHLKMSSSSLANALKASFGIGENDG